jgi:hypothetical protein
MSEMPVEAIGSVATLELRRNLAIVSAKLDRHRAVQREATMFPDSLNCQRDR